MKKPAYTPKEAAIDIALGWLQAAYEGKTMDLDYTMYARTPAQQRRVKVQIAKLHNRLLRSSKMDGVFLEEDL